MESPSARFDRYDVLAPLGVGGMGEVVKARAQGPHGFEKIVAIKRIRADFSDEETFAERFVREARIAAQLQHANIVQVFDFGRHSDELFIVMEYVDGQSLDAILTGLASKGKRPTLAQTLQLALDVSRALDCAHTLTDESGQPMGIIHRDVSPANILVSRTGLVKLTDFGIASFASQQGRTSLVAGKPLYMAPEQLRGDPLDGRSDLFAVGVVMYEMLTGERPWKGLVDSSPTANLGGMGYRPPSVFTTGMPVDVDELVERLLAPRLADRMASARELTKELVALSYRCQIVLDPAELGPLVSEPASVAHAPTVPRYQSKIHTLVATGVSPDGVTMLRTADEDAKRASETPAMVARARGLPVWAWAVLALIVIAAGLGAALSLSGTSTEPIADAPSRTATSSIAAQQPRPMPRTEPSENAPTKTVPPPEPIEPAAAPEPPPEPAPRVRATHHAARPARTGPPHEAPRTGGQGMGELNVFARPWAEIYIDGVRQAQNAPARGLRVSAGRHRVRLVNPVLGLREERTVEVVANDTETVRVIFETPAESPPE